MAKITNRWLKKAYSWGVGDLLAVLDAEIVISLYKAMRIASLNTNRLLSLEQRQVIKRIHADNQELVMIGHNGNKVLELLKKMEETWED